ncbi:MAG: hypothetical protein A2288_02050 [Candidatus Moranbacteria bacterium RIFOXYA12_FULL_44_15]|nr:MAG: hypothetical protein A2288_02050 [Candidatus Moranbacteria bacterium RIFOXYA12_FULL_44_15]OGI35906.1 MAG: hypothetical protein A2259_04995 [Candidatus Moranbacteria bacterium RIFOXYA2_FULL_43_15]
MLDLISSQILFYASIVFILFLPGYFLLRTFFASRTRTTKAGHTNVEILEPLEKFIVIPGLSIIVLDFILFLYSKLSISITQTSIILGIGVFIFACWGIRKLLSLRAEHQQVQASTPEPRVSGKNKFSQLLACLKISSQNKAMTEPQGSIETIEPANMNNLFSFSKNQFILILLLLFSTVFIKTAYLSGTVAPTATDMGHHMYWAKWLAENHQLPGYEGMPDFIIGEHIIFGVLSLVSGADFFSAFPVIILYLINILSILTVFILVLRVFKNRAVAILTLFFLGMLYAVSSPQAKFVSGGVIGNVIGNYLMPLAFYFYYRAFEFLNSKSSQYPPLPLGEDVSSNLETGEGVPAPAHSKIFLSLAVFVTFGLFYTHHLTSFIFLFILLFFVPLFILVNLKNIREIFERAWPIIFSPAVIGTFALGIVFFFFIFTPTYVNPEAVDTAVGTAVKSTRVGLTLENIKVTVGEPRFVLGLIGLLLLILAYNKTNAGYSLVASWLIMLFIMSMKPRWLFVDIPSARIGNYLSYPLAILSAYALYFIFNSDTPKLFGGKISFRVSRTLFAGALLLFVIFSTASGLDDSAGAFKKQTEGAQTVQTFFASKYLAEKASSSDMLLKDHNYITADSWIKLFFMREYKYPLSRGYFKRYEDPLNPREMCTLWMIGSPASGNSEKCFAETGVNFVMVNPRYDSAQFQKLDNFDQIYASNEIAIFVRTTD